MSQTSKSRKKPAQKKSLAIWDDAKGKKDNHKSNFETKWSNISHLINHEIWFLVQLETGMILLFVWVSQWLLLEYYIHSIPSGLIIHLLHAHVVFRRCYTAAATMKAKTATTATSTAMNVFHHWQIEHLSVLSIFAQRRFHFKWKTLHFATHITYRRLQTNGKNQRDVIECHKITFSHISDDFRYIYVIFVCQTPPHSTPIDSRALPSHRQIRSMNHMTLATTRKRGYHIDFSSARSFIGSHFFSFTISPNTHTYTYTCHAVFYSELRVELREIVWFVDVIIIVVVAAFVVVLFSGSLIENFYGTPIYLRPFPPHY